MKRLLSTFLLLLCVSVLVKAATAQDETLKVVPTSKGVKLTCSGGSIDKQQSEIEIERQDSNSKEYECRKGDIVSKVYVKFRSCDNCIDLDIGTITGIIAANLVATAGIGWSVWILAKHTPSDNTSPNKKRSDKQRLVPNDGGDDDNYQRLQYRNGQREVYDKLRR